MRNFIKGIFGMGLILSLTGLHAQTNYPVRPIKIIVPYAAGGSADVITRMLAQKLAEKMDASVIVENKPGANTLIGTEFVAAAPNDGYTLLAATSGNASNPALIGIKGEIFPRDFVPIIGLATTPNVIAVNPSTPYKSLQDLIETSRAKPDSLSYAHAGVGSIQHIVGEQLELTANIKMVDVPYKGGGPATADVLAGQVPVLVSGLTASINFIKSGKLRPLAVTSERRFITLPNVPTVSESGYLGFSNFFWIALYGPNGIPSTVVQKLNTEINQILKNPDLAQLLLMQAAEPWGGTPKDLEQFVKNDIQNLTKVIKASNMKID